MVQHDPAIPGPQDYFSLEQRRMNSTCTSDFRNTGRYAETAAKYKINAIGMLLPIIIKV